jgi:ornithine--oxo-acid transaminase
MNPIIARIDGTSDQESFDLNNRYGTHNYHPLPVNIKRAEGIYAWDGGGKQFVDCIGSYSAVANGHLSPFILETLKAQLDRVTLTSRAVFTAELGCFLKDLCQFTEMDMACAMNTGAEAVETAIKLARKWAYTVKGVAKDKAEIIVAEDNFHGRTTTIVGFSTEAQYRQDFGPFTPGFPIVPFGDIAALEAKINENTAAILMEPIQAEGGILFPPDGYLAEVRRLCDRHRVLLIWDEIQTGFCRTGRRFAWQHEEAKPDMMCLGKALGGGVMPVSAVVGSEEVMSVFKPGDHGSTFGGNPLACVVAMAAMQEMIDKSLTENSARLGENLKAALEKLPHDCIEDVRGRGLLVGLEVKEGTDTKRLAQSFLDAGILTKETRSRTFRFAPPLIITEEQVEDIVARIARALDAVCLVPQA